MRNSIIYLDIDYKAYSYQIVEENWLNAVHFCISPTRELLVFGHGSLLIGLTPQWDDQRREHVFKISWTEYLPDDNDLITSLICLPVISSSHSTQVIYSLSNPTTIYSIYQTSLFIPSRPHPNGLA